MKKNLPVVILATILLQTSLAQTTFKISSYNETPEAFKYLLLSNSEISKNDTINEKILDLVHPMLLDSVIEKKKQHHKVFLVGWLIHAFGGYNWRAVDMVKQKFVGTAKSHGRSGAFEYTEWDIKFHLQFNLPEYFAKICKSCDYQKKLHRQDIRPSHRTDYEKEPFVRTSRNLNPLLYDLGTELTPPPAFIPQLNYLFFPTIPGGGGMKEHPNFQSPNPSMGFYGVSCLDCNHNCHPELHPYEWIWWLKARDEDSSYNKTWLVGLFHEGSNRFKKWSINPMTGSIKVPFAFTTSKYSDPNFRINIEHLVFNKFIDQDLVKMELPKTTISAMNDSLEVFFEGTHETMELLNKDSAGGIEEYVQALSQWHFNGVVHFNHFLRTEGLKYWFSDLNYDKQNKILSGYFNFATSVQDLYTTKITFISDYGN